MKVNPDIFFKFLDGKFVVWNYRSHEQFELSLPYVQRLYALGTGSEAASNPEIDAELQEAKLISPTFAALHWGWDCLSHIFHVGTNMAPLEKPPDTAPYAAYLDHCESIIGQEPEVIETVAGEIVPLPAPDLDRLSRLSLWDALMARRTSRNFSGGVIELGAVSSILYATFGAVHGKDRADLLPFGFRSYGYRRTSPSGGSLQTIEPYLVNFAVRDLAPGIYHYHSLDHKLTRIEGELPASELGKLLNGQHFVKDLSFAVFLVARFEKMWWKYPHSRSYRVALLDAGHLSQTFHLGCAGHALGSFLTAAYYDDEIGRRLKLDPARHAVLFMVGAGIGGGPISRDIQETARAPRADAKHR